LGRDLANELMTGWLNTPSFVSKTTVMSFMDIGFEVQFVPIPTSILLLGCGLIGFFGVTRKRRKT
jgi:hypothetical protein